MTTLKDRGYSTIVPSREFDLRHQNLSKMQKTKSIFRHSSKDLSEQATEVVKTVDLKIGQERFRSSWIVANCRYEVLLGLPWHVWIVSWINNANGKVYTNGDKLICFNWESSNKGVLQLGIKTSFSLYSEEPKKTLRCTQCQTCAWPSPKGQHFN